jgi:hypothetical protein
MQESPAKVLFIEKNVGNQTVRLPGLALLD